MLEAYMYTGRRSPFGRHAGALARLRPDDMLAGVIARVVADSGFAPDFQSVLILFPKAISSRGQHVEAKRMAVERDS